MQTGSLKQKFWDLHARVRLPRRAQRDLKFMGMATPPAITFGLTRSSPFSHDVKLSRRGSAIHVDYQFEQPEHELNTIRRRMSSVIYQFAHCSDEVEEMSVCLGDGFEGTLTPLVFSTNRSDKTPIPDCYQFMLRGFAKMRAEADANAQPWLKRSKTLRWRGADSGEGRNLAEPGVQNDPTVKARLRMCVIAKELEDADCKIYLAERDRSAPAFRFHGILGGRIEETDWINDRYALDIDGMTNTWSNFLARLHLGCCVLKVDSQFGYRQWYYDRIKPWEHYVPVKADMSDLAEKLGWARSNDAEAEQIAQNGQSLARSMTMEHVTRDAARIIETHYLGKPKSAFALS